MKDNFLVRTWRPDLQNTPTATVWIIYFVHYWTIIIIITKNILVSFDKMFNVIAKKKQVSQNVVNNNNNANC